MIIGIIIASFIISLIIFITAAYEDSLIAAIIGGVLLLVALGTTIFGGFHGFINYRPTSGTHIGMVSAVDLEGIHFRRYEVYLKTSQLTSQSDETVYCLYENEKELANQLTEYIGKTVKITYGHDGGYINWKSCGTYHIISIELVEDKD